LRDAGVTFFQGRIVAVGSTLQGAPIKDLGDVAIVPGLVNAHTHLEFSDLACPIGRAGMGLVDWLGEVIRHRANTQASSRSAIEIGLRESSRHGVTAIGEIAQPEGALQAYPALPCDGAVFLELIAPRIERVDAALEVAKTYVRQIGSWRPGLSPHAPYTVHPELLRKVVDLSIEYKLPLAMHLAESREEIDFLRDGSGPFRKLLESRGAWDPTALHASARPLDELHMLSRAHRALVIHGNYLDDEEIEYLGRQRQKMSVVYCPRTHAWFDHDRYPLEKLFAAGANVALGTDSCASAPDLSLFAEMRQVARAFPSMSRATILELGTLGGARALGVESQVGTLEPGKLASLAIIALPQCAASDPHEVLFDANGDVLETWFHGSRVWPV
jgi:cytosine/adenosine deaminase-related metal-dependent hydrolase